MFSKKTLTILGGTLLSLVSIGTVFALSGDPTTQTQGTSTISTLTEEEGCFQILTKSVKDQFGVDLQNVQKDEKSTKKWDVSSYAEFQKQRNTDRNGDPFFRARRNNIGTIIAGSDYIKSQFVSFGDSTNFTFPLKTNQDISALGELYPDFRDNIIYTHHLITTGDFVSCGYLKVTPKAGKELSDLSQENYMTNILGDSGFEVLESSKIIDGKRYLVGKVRVGSIDYAENPLFRIDLITVAYDNQSNIFNEFETFPLQVRAMTNPDAYSRGIDAVQQSFLNSVHEETCLEITHTGIGDLPPQCKGSYQSLSKNTPIAKMNFGEILSKIGVSLIPQASARLNPEDREPQTPIPHGIYTNEAITLDVQDKINALPDSNLREYIRIALTPNFDDYIANRKKNNLVLTPFEKTFSECNIGYAKRVSLITEWIETINIATFDINNIHYPEPKIGDCILPFPDERNKNIFITGSFDTNQLYAKLLTEGTGSLPTITPEEQAMREKIMLGQEYDRRIREARMSNPSLVDALIKEKNEKLGLMKSSEKSEVPEKDIILENRVIIGIVLLISGILLVLLLIRKKPSIQREE